jgi:putative drug exporter of the RND superfamily
MGSEGQGPGQRRRPGRLKPVAAFTTRHPWPVVLVWLAVMGTLGVLGNGLEHKVSTQAVYVAGSAAERAHEIGVRKFGREDTLVLMLRGPRAAVDRQGRKLVGDLQSLPRALVLSPWSSSGSIKGLRPAPGVAALLVTIGQPSTGSSSDIVPEVQDSIHRAVSGPVRASVAGGPAVVDSLRDAIARATAFGEKLALPVLLIVLLLVCRAVLAAALPVVIGGFVAAATKGVLYLFAGTMAIDSIALGTAGMFGLALGVDYSLLIVSRFREEIEKDGDVERAVQRTVISTGRSILPAGCGLILALLVAVQLIPGSFIASVGLAAITATVLSVLSAMFLAPAALTLLGARLNRWSLPRRRESGSYVMGWSRRLSTRPGIVLGLVFALMLCAVWAFTLQTNVGVASLLPPNDPGRLAQERIERELGPGWVAPFEIMMSGGGHPVTTPQRLAALTSFQRKVERDPGVEAMAGFASLHRATKALGSVQGNLAAQERGTVRLGRGLARVRDGSAATTGGLLNAAGGARQLGSGIGESQSGSGQLTSGLQSSSKGSARLSGGLGRTSEGSGKLTDATAKATSGADRLTAKVRHAQKQNAEAAGSNRSLKNAMRSGESSLDAAPLEATEEQLTAAWQALQRMTGGRSDAQYGAAVEAVRAASRELTGADPESEEEGESSSGVAASVRQALDQFNLGLYLVQRQDKSQQQASDGIEKLAKASSKLDHGLRRLLDHSRELTSSVARLSRSGAQLPPGLRRLAAGAGQLLGGLGELENGAGGLAGGLGNGARQSRQLTAALGRLHSGAEAGGGSQLSKQSPGLFRSGYFYLAGLDGGSPEQRRQAGFLVNLSRGGSAARMLVIPRNAQATPGAKATGDRLTEDAAELSRETGGEVVVGGLSPTLVDLNSALRDQTPLARLVLSLLTIIVLIPVTRSLALPLIAALLNLLTVSATFGLMSILFNGSLLGGPGFVDASVIPATVMLTFGLAIDYEVFILARIREEYVRTGSTATAIASGLGKTAPVISGAAVIMIGVFVAFSISPLAILRNLGVALAIGVVIDAFIVRFVLLPAIMRALGDRCWWIPRWLERILPGGTPDAVGAEA